MSTSLKYEIRRMHEDDYDQVLALLTKSFFHDEPITRHLQVTENETLGFSKNTITACLQDQCSFVAYDTLTNQIVGLCLNESIEKNSKHEINESNENIRFILQLFADTNKNLNIFDQLNTNTLLHIFIINVDKIARGHGLASRLISKSIEYAKELNIHGAYAEVTNIYSLNCFKQQQFISFDELIYADYSPERLANMKDPMYDRCYLVGRKL
jgi:ribosomal protein S18 acetylase RimI-like enzyme